MCERMRKAFPRFVQDAYNNHQNILIVAEDFDRIKEMDFKRMRFWLQPYKRIKVVTTYRRLHNWLPSWYNQIVDLYTLLYVSGEKYPSFVEWLDKNYVDFFQVHAIQLANRFNSYDIVESVDILNMHGIPDLIEYFFCSQLQTNTTCQAIKDGAKPSKSNTGTEHEYERVTIKAALGGKIKTSLHKPVTLERVTRRVKEKVEEIDANDPLPKICPSKTLLEQILQTEMEHERTYFPEWYESQGGDEGLRKSFEAAVKKKFCSFDVDKILRMGTLDSVFKEVDLSFGGK